MSDRERAHSVVRWFQPRSFWDGFAKGGLLALALVAWLVFCLWLWKLFIGWLA